MKSNERSVGPVKDETSKAKLDKEAPKDTEVQSLVETEMLKVEEGKVPTTTRGFDKEEEKMLKEYDFYHGFIPREDIPSLVRKAGDYLLRVSEVNSNEPTRIRREIVLSVYVEDNEGRKSQRNAIIRRMPNNRYMVADEKEFDTFKELIAYYQNNYGKLTKARFMLKNPITLQRWELLHADIKLGKQLGEGAFGEVRQAVWTKRLSSGKTKEIDVAVKMTKGTNNLCKAKIKEMMSEARVIRRLKEHKNIVKIHGVAVDEQPLFIVLELVKGGALNSYLAKNKCSLEEKLNMCLGAARGVEHLHKSGIIHRDLAARNCLYDYIEKQVKLSDFGLSRHTKEYRIKTAVKLPIKWLAPETITTYIFNSKTDIFSYGVMVHEIFANGTEPWEGVTNTEVKKSVIDGKHVSLKDAPEKVRDFIREKAFVKDPQERASALDIIRFFELQLDPLTMAEPTTKIYDQSVAEEDKNRPGKGNITPTPNSAGSTSSGVKSTTDVKKGEQTKPLKSNRKK